MIIRKSSLPMIEADTDPTAADDLSVDGVVLGVYWLNVTTGDMFVCKDVTAATAVWNSADGGPAGPQGIQGIQGIQGPVGPNGALLDFDDLDEQVATDPDMFFFGNVGGINKKFRYSNLQFILPSSLTIYYSMRVIELLTIGSQEIL